MRSLVRFRAGGGEYAIDLAAVVRVEDATPLAPLPGAADPVAGILHAEDGEALSVLDAFGGRHGRILVLSTGDLRFGVAVEDVAGVATVEDSQVGPRPPGAGSGLVTGVLRDPGGSTMVVDQGALARLLGG